MLCVWSEEKFDNLKKNCHLDRSEAQRAQWRDLVF